MEQHSVGLLQPDSQTILQDVRERLHRLYGGRLEKLVLFGSQARGDAHSDSDIDLMLILDGTFDPYQEIKRVGDIVLDMSLQYGVTLNLIHVTTTDYANTHHPLMMNVHEEGIAL